MLVFIAALICIIFLVFTSFFIIFLFSILNPKVIGTKITLFSMYLISLPFISFWTYSQILLIISGNIEKLKYNLYFPFNILLNYPITLVTSIKLSLEYNTPMFIISISFISIIFTFVYCKSKNKRGIKPNLLFAGVIIYFYLHVPFIIIEQHNEEKEEIATVKEVTRISENSQILSLYKVGRHSLRSYGECSSAEYYPNEEGYSEIPCSTTAKLCFGIRNMDKYNDVRREDRDKLSDAKDTCKSYGWYEK